jgi:YfiR/HmsC-like
MRRRPRWIWALTLVAALGFEQARGDSVTPEYQVKAAFLYKFATYIHWPEATETTPAPFVVGILGKDPFGSSLGTVVRGQNVHGKAIVIRKLARAEEALHCDVLFVSSSERERLPQILGALGSAPVLTVGDMDRFAERGGMINLITTEDNHIRFDINKAAIDRAGLKAPSQLLRLARIINASLAAGEGR